LLKVETPLGIAYHRYNEGGRPSSQYAIEQIQPLFRQWIAGRHAVMEITNHYHLERAPGRADADAVLADDRRAAV
jgi:hypothetical protein